MGYSIPSKPTQIWSTLLELSLFAILATTVGILELSDIEPQKRGFFCDDENINHPYKSDTISTFLCFVIWLFISIVVIVSVESIFYFVFRPLPGPWKDLHACKMPRYALELYRIFGFLVFGGTCTMIIVDIAKITIGRLRPNFRSICNYQDCAAEKDGIFIIDYQCNPEGNFTQADVIEARKSFLSGHSAFSFYFAVFLTLYLQERLTNAVKHRSQAMPKQWAKIFFRGLKITRPFLQFSMLALAFYISLTRVMDYKHHPLDVLSGAILGISSAYLVIYHVMKLQKKPSTYYTLSNHPDVENNSDMVDLGGASQTVKNDQQRRKHDNVQLLSSL